MKPFDVAFGGRTILCALSLSLAVAAQCPGNYPPPEPPGPPPKISGPAGTPTVTQPATPRSPAPATPAAPAPSGPRTGGPAGPPTGGRVGAPRTGGRRGMPITLTRSNASKRRLKIDWDHPVPPVREGNKTAAAGPMPRAEAIAHLWDKDDGRPLLVLRECNLCKGSDGALLSRSLVNDKTMLLTKWFRTVKMPAHIAERRHPFHNVFAGYDFGKKVPHFFLLAHKDAQPVAFTGAQTQSKLWKGMYKVLEQRYAKNPKRNVKKWLMLLDRFDTIDGQRAELKEQLLAIRATKGPDSSKAKKIEKRLADLDKQWAEAEAEEKKVRDLGLLKAPTKVAAK